jgi:hypothetical protein
MSKEVKRKEKTSLFSTTKKTSIVWTTPPGI